MKLLLSLLCFAVPAGAAPQKGAARSNNAPAPAVPAPAPVAAPSNTATLDPSVKTRIESFFKSVQERKVQDGFTKLFEGSTLAGEQPKLLETLTKNTLLLVEKCGGMDSASIIRVRGAGTSLREVTCIMNCEKRPMRWTMYVYKAEGRWQVIDAEVDLELHRFFDPDKNAAD